MAVRGGGVGGGVGLLCPRPISAFPEYPEYLAPTLASLFLVKCRLPNFCVISAPVRYSARTLRYSADPEYPEYLAPTPARPDSQIRQVQSTQSTLHLLQLGRLESIAE